MSGIDFSERAKPIAQAYALCEVSRMKLGAALSQIYRLPPSATIREAQEIAAAALKEEARPRG